MSPITVALESGALSATSLVAVIRAVSMGLLTSSRTMSANVSLVDDLVEWDSTIHPSCRDPIDYQRASSREGLLLRMP